MDKEQVRTVIEEDEWYVSVWNFMNEIDAEQFILNHFERKCKECWMDTYKEVNDFEEQNLDSYSFHFDWYYLYMQTSYLFNINPSQNDWTKEFRGDTKRSRQEDRNTPRDWWEA